jgi:Ser-tRNA(Ala) deacylase AlaX
MNLEARKIEFVQEFLKLESEDVISLLEKILRKENENYIEPMTKEELNKRIDQSESDFINGRFKTSAEILAKYK